MQRRPDCRRPIVEKVADQDGADQHAGGVAHGLSSEDGGTWRRDNQVEAGRSAGQHVGQAGPGAQVAIPGDRIGDRPVTDDPDDFTAGRIDGFDDHVGMNRQRPLQPCLQCGGIGPVLA